MFDRHIKESVQLVEQLTLLPSIWSSKPTLELVLFHDEDDQEKDYDSSEKIGEERDIESVLIMDLLQVESMGDDDDKAPDTLFHDGMFFLW